ncbi:Ctf8-domain-containing protein [Chlamydoabsidia padenii]|nr:Ctf8-domain-containing protein [Chlamydoabsidia padenii]
MVHAVIHSLVNSDNKLDLILLEFQGSFQGTSDSVKGIKIGEIHVEKDSAYVLIGHHRIEGVRKKLTKPLAVIHKQGQHIDAMDLDQQGATEYNVTTIIREKIIFTNRPRLIVKESLRGLTKIGG